MANAGLPGTSGFVGEFFVILASYQASFWYAFLAATTLILGAAYTLWMVKRVVFGDIANEQVKTLTDMNRREGSLLVILAISASMTIQMPVASTISAIAGLNSGAINPMSKLSSIVSIA